MAAGMELGQPFAAVERLQPWRHLGRGVAQVHAQAGEHAGEFLHVALAVATVHAQRVQLHQLAGVVLVEAARRVLLVVEVAQHGRVRGAGDQQIAEATERVRAQGPLVIADQHAQIGLGLPDIEVVEPEPGHLLAQAVRRMQRQQQRAAGRLARHSGQPLLVVLAVLAAAALLQIGHQRRQRHLADGQRIDRRLHRRGQCGVLWRMQQRLHGVAPAAPGPVVDAGRAGAPGEAVQQGQIRGVQRTVRRPHGGGPPARRRTSGQQDGGQERSALGHRVSPEGKLLQCNTDMRDSRLRDGWN